MPNKSTSIWLPRVVFESALITVSILLALGLDEWRENREAEEMIKQAMSNFVSEIRQNKSRIDDDTPFTKGLHEVIGQRYRDGDITSMSEFIAIVDSYRPVALQSAAWETAVATGSLARMDYNLVLALSLTYNMQDRYMQINRAGMSDLVSPKNLSPETLNLAIYGSLQHLKNVTIMETELSDSYDVATAVLREAWMSLNDVTEEETSTWAGDAAHP
jgi:hypothetical protein